MARMCPSSISPDTKSDAERTLYEAFRDQLNDEYTVFHSVAWQSKDRQGRVRDGEADFVIAHPQLGILVLEAKGGAIRCDPATRAWTSTDPDGEVHAIKDPFGQAKDSRYILREQLQRMLSVSSSQVCVGHAVAFPDVAVGQECLGLDRPRQIVLDVTDLAQLADWVERALTYWRGQENMAEGALGAKVVDALVELLSKAWELRPALWGQITQEQQRLIRLTEQQYQVLDLLNRQRRALICGCARSGKTMLAAEKAARLARQGFSVLLVCYNKSLAVDLRWRLKAVSGLEVAHFHDLCYRTAEQARTLPRTQGPQHVFYDQQLPEALMKATETVGIRYDAIVVDEGQDFQEHWWIPLQNLLRDPDNGILYVFFDDNQRLYVERSSFPIPQEPYCLSVNCRNTRNIHQLVLRFYAAEDLPTSLGPVGRPVELVIYEKIQGLQAAVRSIIGRLTEVERIPPEEIAVLSPLLHKSQLWAEVNSGRSLFNTSWPPRAGSTYFGSIHAFKGLERPVVVLVELEHWWENLVSLLYTGCSRACNHLIVVLPEDVSPEIQQAFAATGDGG